MIRFSYETLDGIGLTIEAEIDGSNLKLWLGDHPFGIDALESKDQKSIKEQLKDWVIHYRVMESHPAALEANYSDWINGGSH